MLAVGQAIQGYSRKASDPNLFTCSLIGGPDAYDNFTDRTDNYDQTEPATYTMLYLLACWQDFMLVTTVTIKSSKVNFNDLTSFFEYFDESS